MSLNENSTKIIELKLCGEYIYYTKDYWFANGGAYNEVFNQNFTDSNIVGNHGTCHVLSRSSDKGWLL